MKRTLFVVAYAGLLFASHQFEDRPGEKLRSDERRSDFLMPASGNEAAYSFSLTWREAGHGPVLLLLHGSPGGSGDFERLIPLLARRYRVLAPDLPGFGKSTQKLSDYGIRAQARRMSAFLDARGIQEVAVLGYSLGSGVALELAAADPIRVRQLILYGGIGIQEGEGSGSWLVEHLKYAAGWLFVCALPEALPHFGLLGSWPGRSGFIRSFLDTDQRPLREIIKGYSGPVLLLHGTDDVLVPVEAARDHSVLFPNAHLVELPGSHFLVFTDAGSQLLASHIVSFRESPGRSAKGKSELFYSPRPAWISDTWALFRFFAAAFLAGWLAVDAGVVLLAALAASGFLDVQSILLAYFLGFLFTRIRTFFAAPHFLSPHTERLLRLHPGEAGRLFLRGIFTPALWRDLTQAARGRLTAFGGIGALWGVASLVVLFFLFPITIGFSALAPPGSGRNRFWILSAALPAFAILRTLLLSVTAEGRRRIRVFFARSLRLEFYPAYLFYVPLIPTILRLSFQNGGFTTIAASNPGFPDGGFVGESKAEILEMLPRKWTLAHFLAEGGRVDDTVRELSRRSWKYPVIVKPDAGQKGMGVTLCKTESDLRAAVTSARWPVLVQKYHPGPFEAGIFYVRNPSHRTGSIFSITDKHLPVLVGDGHHTLEDIILSHPRYALQSDLFLERHRARLQEIPAAGKTILLGSAGNHFQGALFRDGAHLITPALTKSIDLIARSVPGFYFGRFDVRYKSAAEFRRGRGFQIVELNGATSESTNVYDPDMPVGRVYQILREQWEILFRTGRANILAGAARPPFFNLVRAYRHYRQIAPHPHSR